MRCTFTYFPISLQTLKDQNYYATSLGNKHLLLCPAFETSGWSHFPKKMSWLPTAQMMVRIWSRGCFLQVQLCENSIVSKHTHTHRPGGPQLKERDSLTLLSQGRENGKKQKGVLILPPPLNMSYLDLPLWALSAKPVWLLNENTHIIIKTSAWPIRQLRNINFPFLLLYNLSTGI